MPAETIYRENRQARTLQAAILFKREAGNANNPVENNFVNIQIKMTSVSDYIICSRILAADDED